VFIFSGNFSDRGVRKPNISRRAGFDRLRFQPDAVPQKMIATKSRDAVLENDNGGLMTTNGCSKTVSADAEILMLLQFLIDAAANVR
jgi:hypothetical protein